MDMPTSDTRGGRRGRPTAAQVVALGLVAASFGSAIWLLEERPVAEEVELLPGTVLPSSEMALVEAAFDRAELIDHRTESGRVFVPRQRQASYMRALVDAEALPREFGSSLRRALENESPWRSRAVQEEMLRVAIQDELAHVICSMPGIERAAVLYDGGEPRPFPGAEPQRAATASVNVSTQADAVLEPERVQAIRVLVAASIAGLEAERVAVTDLRSGQVHVGSLDAATPGNDVEFARRVARERHLAAKLRQALGFIRGVVVDVTLAPAGFAPPPEQDTVEPHLPRQRQRVADANAPAEIDLEPPSVAPPREPTPVPAPSLIVNVAVPESFVRAAVAGDRGGDRVTTPEAAAAEERERERLVAHVRNLLPPPTHAEDHRIVVTFYPTPSIPSAPTTIASPATRESSATTASTFTRVVEELRGAVERGDPAAVPRQVWLVVAAGCAAIVLWFVLRDTSAPRGRRERARRRGHPAIDWQDVGSAGQAALDDGGLAGISEPPRGVAA
jgi:type III secretory pathway lipoprotein EscJ